MKKTELSIIIPVYNGQDYIVRCLDSILRQRDAGHYEIIVVNDGSIDNTSNILNSIAKSNKNVHIIHQKNGGVSVARNNGIRAAHGKYVTFVDCDDMVGLNINAFDKYFINLSHQSNIGNMKISSVHDVLPYITQQHFDDGYFVNMLHAASDTNADVIFGGKITINRQEAYMRRHIYEDDFVYDETAVHKHIVLRHANVRENANFALYRRKMLDEHHLRFLVNMQLDEDILFCMMAGLYAKRVATVKDVTYFYNRHSDTLSNISDFDTMMQKYKIANIQLFSVFLNKLCEMPQYKQIFTYWLKEYSKKGTTYSHDSGEFPPMECHYFCDHQSCNDCIIATGMKESIKDNIAKYLGKTTR